MLRYYAKACPSLPLKESTVRQPKNEYQSFVKDLPKDEKNEVVKELPRKMMGKPLLLGDELDKQVKDYIKYQRERGTAVNTTVVMASSRGYCKKQRCQFAKGEGWIWRH